MPVLVGWSAKEDRYLADVFGVHCDGGVEYLADGAAGFGLFGALDDGSRVSTFGGDGGVQMNGGDAECTFDLFKGDHCGGFYLAGDVGEAKDF